MLLFLINEYAHNPTVAETDKYVLGNYKKQLPYLTVEFEKLVDKIDII